MSLLIGDDYPEAVDPPDWEKPAPAGDLRRRPAPGERWHDWSRWRGHRPRSMLIQDAPELAEDGAHDRDGADDPYGSDDGYGPDYLADRITEDRITEDRYRESGYADFPDSGPPTLSYHDVGYAEPGHQDPDYAEAGYPGSAYPDSGYPDSGYSDAVYPDSGHAAPGSDATTGPGTTPKGTVSALRRPRRTTRGTTPRPAIRTWTMSRPPGVPRCSSRSSCAAGAAIVIQKARGNSPAAHSAWAGSCWPARR